MYRQVSVTYCDLHDRSGRMKCLGAIHEELRWADCRAYLHWRIRRRMRENAAVREMMIAVPEMTRASAAAVVGDLCGEAVAGGDEAVATWLESHSVEIDARIELERQRAVEARIYEMVGALPVDRQVGLVRDLLGYVRVAGSRK
mmetsp:Transcript_74452/g.215862  ORF Transcript_74452/g.215862 Transcript_74452/m.215862 type:complete len:144 (+) Transcript_74452:3-434(+)